MREFLRFLQRCGHAPVDPRVLDARIGSEQFSALRALGVVVDSAAPTTLPCGGMGDCRREIVVERDGGLRAVCGADAPSCESHALTAADVARVAISMEEVAKLLAMLLRLDPAGIRRVEPSTAWSLGRADGGAVLFAPSPFARSFELLLLAQPGRTVVYVPCRERVPLALEQRHRSGERVELRFLEDSLTVREGRVLLQEGRLESPQELPASMRVVLERAGERRVSDPEYAALLTSGAHLVLDLTRTSEHGGYTAHVRVDGRKARKVPLPARQAHAIVELMRAGGRPMRASELRSLRDAEVRDPERLVEIARKAVDVPLGRYQWRAFHTVRGSTPDAKAYAFRPPPEMTFAVVLPAT
jgi:hypothetical protein